MKYLCTTAPETWNWNEEIWNEHYGILEMIPEELREQKIIDALMILYYSGKISGIGHLKTKIPIEDTEEALRGYIGCMTGPSIFYI